VNAFFDLEGRLRLHWRFVIVMAGLFAIQIAVGIVLGIALVVASIVTGGSATAAVPAPWRAWAELVAFVPSALLLIALVCACRRWLDRRPIRSLGLERPRWSVLLAFALGLAAGVLPAAVLIAAGGYRFTGVSASLQTAFLAPVLAVMAFEEEILCRGYLQQNLIDAGRPAAALIVSTLVFWLLHAFNPGMWSSPLPSLNLVVVGVLLALAYRVAGNIWLPTALHYAWNLAQGIVLQLPVSGLRFDGVFDLESTGRLPSWLTGGTFGLESSVLTTAATAPVAVAFALVLKRRSRTPADV